jgi:hypothetical protein
MEKLMEACVERENRSVFHYHLIRKTVNMNQKDFPGKIDIARSYLSDIVEKGKYNKGFAIFEKIYKTLNIDLNWLIIVKIGIHLQVRKCSLNMIFFVQGR